MPNCNNEDHESSPNKKTRLIFTQMDYSLNSMKGKTEKIISLVRSRELNKIRH